MCLRYQAVFLVFARNSIQWAVYWRAGVRTSHHTWMLAKDNENIREISARKDFEKQVVRNRYKLAASNWEH